MYLCTSFQDRCQRSKNINKQGKQFSPLSLKVYLEIEI